MKQTITIILLLFLFGCKSNVKEIVSEKANFFAELNIEKSSHIDYLSLIFTNNSDSTVGICLIGGVQVIKDDPDSLTAQYNKLVYDTVIEIIQNDITFRSDLIGLKRISLSSRIPELLIIKPDSSVIFNIFYRGKLVEDFKLNEEPFKIRVRVKPQDPEIFNDQEFKRAEILFPDIKIIKNEIISNFVEVNS